MNCTGRYSIGDMSRICNISKKALRYYDKIGLITSKRQSYNNYRYYTSDALLAVPVIKYYKQMGFKLDEMQAFIEGGASNVFGTIQTSFLAKSKELELMQEEIRRKHVSVTDWHAIIMEAQMAIDNRVQQVSAKYIEPQVMIFQEQIFENDIKAAIINIDWTNYLESIRQEITGAVHLGFSSFADRVNGNRQKVTIMQKALMPCQPDQTTTFGGCMMVSCYHIGPHETLNETYKKISTWARQHGYVLGEALYERYIADYWLTGNSALFVTEVMLKISKRTDVPCRSTELWTED